MHCDRAYHRDTAHLERDVHDGGHILTHPTLFLEECSRWPALAVEALLRGDEELHTRVPVGCEEKCHECLDGPSCVRIDEELEASEGLAIAPMRQERDAQQAEKAEQLAKFGEAQQQERLARVADQEPVPRNGGQQVQQEPGGQVMVQNFTWLTNEFAIHVMIECRQRLAAHVQYEERVDQNVDNRHRLQAVYPGVIGLESKTKGQHNGGIDE